MRIAALLLCAAGGAGAQGTASCPPGERIHWIADYCMAQVQTDDEIAAGDCINEKSDLKLGDDCATKRHFKRELCRLVRKDDVERCVRDPAFTGRTVRDGGVRGR